MSQFTIYNASAGSGKTYMLVKEYLKKILLSPKENSYKHLLAITFTNKAVAEMKQRIVSNLIEFSNWTNKAETSTMHQNLADELEVSPSEIKNKAKKILKSLLHNYAAFDVETIDRFNHRLIRTFAKDLALPVNFEVSLDIDSLLNETVDRFIDNAGIDEKLTNVLVDFALEKTDDDKSWDISFDLNKIAGLLKNETDQQHIAKLSSKTINDFLELKKMLAKRKANLTKSSVDLASEALLLIEHNGLEFQDFNGGSRAYLPNYFLKVTRAVLPPNFDAKWQQTLDEKPLYPQRASPVTAEMIDAIAPQLIAAFYKIKELVLQLFFVDAILKKITPLSVLNEINNEYKALKKEKSVLPISEFNKIINAEIEHQPAPFIYERLGEKYNHFFIDEFQDTSALQWKNLIPLIDNALSQESSSGEKGTVMLVGDAKQSIYRWRGGFPEQFMDLYNEKENPFSINDIDHFNLDTNYRSYDEIIHFNNRFFSHISGVLNDEEHKNLYLIGNNQTSTDKKGGYVNISFIEAKAKTEEHEIYPQKVLETILQLKEKGFNESEICVLTRKRDEGVRVASYLSEKGISIISSETLLLQNSETVRFLVNMIRITSVFTNEESKVEVFLFLKNHLVNTLNTHAFLNAFLQYSETEFEKRLLDFDISFSFQKIQSKSLFEGVEYLLRSFNLLENITAYERFFINVVLDFEEKNEGYHHEFLEYWDNKKDKLSIQAPQQSNAVQVLTIHKSKGLEFPVVIFPYGNLSLSRQNDPTIWFPLEKEDYCNFTEAFIPYSKKVQTFGKIGNELYQKTENTVALDTFNILYVTLTRAVEQLYIITTKEGSAGTKNTAGLFRDYLESIGVWDDNTLTYDFGNIAKVSENIEDASALNPMSSDFISTEKEMHNIHLITKGASLWNSEAKKAIDQGLRIHELMALIKTVGDIAGVFETYNIDETIPLSEVKKDKEIVDSIVNNKLLVRYYSVSAIVKNEVDIATKEGEIIRPDRLNFHENNEVTIIDYKVGSPNERYKRQLDRYQKVLEEMNYKIQKKILIYINDKIDVVVW